MLALGENNKNNTDLSKSLKKLSSGMRLNSAGDGASDYAISEKMRVLTRSLDQDIENSKKGIDLVKIAEGGIQSIVDELRNMKAMALDSANGHNSDIDRAIIQKEFSSRMKEIEDIASTTDYNGIILLDGRWCSTRFEYEVGKRRTVSQNTVVGSSVTSPVTSTTVGPTTTTQIIPKTSKTTTKSNTVTSDDPPSSTGVITKPSVTTSNTVKDTSVSSSVISSKTDKTSEKEVTQDEKYTTEISKDKTKVTTTTATTTTDTETTTTQTVTETEIISFKPVTTTIKDKPIIIKNGTTSITKDGIYEFAPDYTGTLTISAKSVEIMGPATGETLTDVSIIDNGVEDLWLKNVNIFKSDNSSVIVFDSSSKNTLHLLGSNSISESGYRWDTTDGSATINAGGGLSIVGNGSLSIKNDYHRMGAIIGSNMGSSCGDINIGQGVTIDIVSKQSCVGAAIGSGGIGGSCGDITIGSNSNINIYKDSSLYPLPQKHHENVGACIGAGNGGQINSTCGNITIYSSATVIAHGDGGPGIGASSNSSVCGNITIYSDVDVTAYSLYSAAIGTGNSGYYYPLVSNVNNPPLLSQCGSITIYSYSSGKISAKTDAVYAEDIGHGYTTAPRLYSNKVGNVRLLNTSNNKIGGIADFSEPALGETTKNQYEITTEVITKTETTKQILKTVTTQYDTSTTETDSVTTTVYENLDPELVEVLTDPLIIHTGPKSSQNLKIYINDMRPDAMGLSDVAVDSLDKAVEAIDKLDTALNYALDEITTMGAYQIRLQEVIDNLTIENENMTASESVIRDADMAKEMANYIKDNILSQTSQAMLANANQSSSTVLSLLQ